MVCAGPTSSQHGRRPQDPERRIPRDQGSLSRRVRADGQRTRARRGLSADCRGHDPPRRRLGDCGFVQLRRRRAPRLPRQPQGGMAVGVCGSE